MSASVDQIADRIYRISTFVPALGPTGFTFNQFLAAAPHAQVAHGSLGVPAQPLPAHDAPVRVPS